VKVGAKVAVRVTLLPAEMTPGKRIPEMLMPGAFEVIPVTVTLAELLFVSVKD
jgi:hypothetical protein